MVILSKTKPDSDAVDYFDELSFHNKPIEKPKVKRLKNIDRLAELPFYEQLSVMKRVCNVVQSLNNLEKRSNGTITSK